MNEGILTDEAYPGLSFIGSYLDSIDDIVLVLIYVTSLVARNSEMVVQVLSPICILFMYLIPTDPLPKSSIYIGPR